jgi:transcriptional regulator with XRE-family HTH domain
MPEPDDDSIALGRALRVLRKRAGLTQVQAGEHVEIGGNHLSNVELGERILSYRTMLALLRLYGSSLRELAALIEEEDAD